MAKDPAFLFYPGDWLGGTMTFNRSHKGAYMDLLMCQFNSGHMALHDVRIVLGENDFTEMWEAKLKSKFCQDENGKFFNEKLEREIFKRKNFTKSRVDNLKNIPHMEVHMDDHKKAHTRTRMENENENRNNTVFIWENEKQKFLNDGSWQFKFCSGKNILVDHFDTLAKEFISDLELKEDYKSIKEIRRHFTNWYNIKTKSDGTDKQAAGSNSSKLGTSAARIATAKNW